VRRWALAGSAGLAFLAALGGVAHAGPSTADRAVQIRHVDTSGFPNIAVTVSVPAQVSAQDLRVRENHHSVSVVSVRSLAETSGKVDIVLALDTSNSVQGAPLAAAVTAARGFVEKLPPSIGVGLLTFSDRALVVQPITQEHAVILSALDSISATQQGTALFDGVSAAVGMFSTDAEHNIVLLTDGADVGSTKTLADAVAAARGHHITIFTVGLGADADVKVLQRFSGETGGTFTGAAEAELPTIYADLAGQLARQYVITYRSAATAGAEVTVGVGAAGDHDQALVLTPRSTTAGTQPVRGPLLHGVTGLGIVLGLSFFGVFLPLALVLVSVGRSRRDRELARRITVPSQTAPGQPARAQQGPTAWIPGSLVQVGERVAEVGGFKDRVGRRLERAGVPITPGEYVAGVALAFLAGAALGGLTTRNVFVALALALVGAIVPPVILSMKMKKRINTLHTQLPDVLMILASSMRAGHSFLQALDTVAKEIGEPSTQEFSRVVAEIRLGRPPEEALLDLAERVGTEEFRWAMVAVNVQRDVGGNLAEVLDTLAETVRERETVRRQVKVLSAEGRLSMKIMMALPPLLTLYMLKVNPSYMKILWTTRIGWFLIAGAAILMLLGILVARRIVRIDV
jgi:tight adherence protein B